MKVFKVKMDLSPVIMKEIFQYTENPFYDLRSNNQLWRTNIRTVCFGSESIANLGTEIWNLVPQKIKVSKTFDTFKSKIKRSSPQNSFQVT